MDDSKPAPFSRADLLKNLLVDTSGLDTSELLPDVSNEKKLLWFQNVTGTTEKEFRLDMGKYMKLVDGKIEFHHPNGEKIRAGHFQLLRLGDMMANIESRGKNVKPYPHFEIVTRLDNASLRFVDVSHIQALPENNGALFQVASNFNGTEAQTELQDPDSENFTTKYIYDKTQGPAASISAGGAAVSRVYGVWMKDKPDKPDEWAQTEKRQVNFLEALPEHFPVTNGYVTCKDPNPRFPVKQWKKLLGMYQIGFHQSVQVTSGYRFADTRHKNQTIDQCFCAAMNLQQGGTGARNKGLPDGEIKAQFLLDAAYHGTYLTALTHKKQQLFLTMIGGGAFGNDKAWIFDSIFYAHQKWARMESCELQKVTLLLYNPTDVSKVFLNKFRQNGIPYTLVAYHNCKRTVIEEYYG